MTFIASIEIEPLSGSKMEEGRKGALVYCLIPATSRKVATRRLQAALEEDKYRLVRTEFLEDYKNFRWENAKDQVEYDGLAKRAALNDDVIYGPFFSWTSDE